MDIEDESTRRALIRAGEKLFATKAASEVSEAEIAEHAGVADNQAVQTYFGDRAGLLKVIIDIHQIPVDARRNRLLDDLVRDGVPDVRSAVEVLVHPLADKLYDPYGGREYLQICARLRRDPEQFGMLLSRTTGISRALEFITPYEKDVDPDTSFLRLQIISTMIVHGLADFAEDDDDDHGRSVTALIDAICAVIEHRQPAVAGP